MEEDKIKKIEKYKIIRRNRRKLSLYSIPFHFLIIFI